MQEGRGFIPVVVILFKPFRLLASFWRRYCKEVIIGVNDDSIEGGFLGPYNYSNCQGSASSHRFSCLFRPSTKASHRIASQVVNNSYFKEALRAL